MEKTLYRWMIIVSMLLPLITGWLPAGYASIPERNQQPNPVTPLPARDQAVIQAFEQAITRAEISAASLAAVLYDVSVNSLHYSADGSTVLLWLQMTDPETGEGIASEPGLSIAYLQDSRNADLSASWSITLPSDAAFTDSLRALPQDLLSEDLLQRWIEPADQVENAISSSQPFTGYKLPWQAGLKKLVTNTIGHVYSVAGGLTSCPATCRYAYDFADGTMFQLLASKGGTVKAWKTDCSNNDEKCTNYLVLEDRSTNPVSYQLYYHMMYDSVPAQLRVLGASVLQGQVIGNADDTGFSTGSHLHYHVYTSATGTNWSWGPSVDFIYDDVTDNGGYPRTCAEAEAFPELGSQCQKNNLYVSGNLPANPPNISLAAPVNQHEIFGDVLQISGRATDDTGVARIQAQVNYDGTWKALGDIQFLADGTFSTQVNLSAAGVPDGPFMFMVKAYDLDGGQARSLPLVSLSKTTWIHPPLQPACTPSTNQVSLYDQPGFQGNCQVFDLRDAAYLSGDLSMVAENSVESIQVGSGVRAVVFDLSSDAGAAIKQGRIESFESDDSGLGDNPIGARHVSAVLVQPRSTLPEKPAFLHPAGPQWASGTAPTSIDSLVLAWTGGSGATSYQVTLSGPSSMNRTVKGTSISIGSLPAGEYTLNIQSINSAGNSQASTSFSVITKSLDAGASRGVPYTDPMDSSSSGWTASGLWRWEYYKPRNTGSNAWLSYNETSYADETWKAGDLTSPPIALPAGTTQWLRFRYAADIVEDNPLHWDRRLVQISVNNGPFVDLWQPSADRRSYVDWRFSELISLAEYAGKTIRLRFHFDAVDPNYNTAKGWAVDDVTITTAGPVMGCADNDANGPENARLIVSGQMIQGAVICPEGDSDWYKFHAKAGQTVRFDLDAKSLTPASKLDSFVYLIDSDGRSVLGSNDDEVYMLNFDSLIDYLFLKEGDYYLKVVAWNHPGVGGQDFYYTLTMQTRIQGAPPVSVNIISPSSPTSIPGSPLLITVQAEDAEGGDVAGVDIFWHSGDWINSAWMKLGPAIKSDQGWVFQADLTGKGSQTRSAIYALARGKGGGTKADAMFDIKPSYPFALYMPVMQRK